MPRRTAIALFLLLDLFALAGGAYYFRNFFWHYCETEQCKSNPKGVFAASKPSI
jgi:hypothetical protein